MTSDCQSDERERRQVDYMRVSANIINETEGRPGDSKKPIENSSIAESLNQLTNDKIRALLRLNEELGARLFEADRLLNGADISGPPTLPLEVKLAQRVMERMPLFFRKLIRKLAALALAFLSS